MARVNAKKTLEGRLEGYLDEGNPRNITSNKGADLLEHHLPCNAALFEGLVDHFRFFYQRVHFLHSHGLVFAEKAFPHPPFELFTAELRRDKRIMFEKVLSEKLEMFHESLLIFESEVRRFQFQIQGGANSKTRKDVVSDHRKSAVAGGNESDSESKLVLEQGSIEARGTAMSTTTRKTDLHDDVTKPLQVDEVFRKASALFVERYRLEDDLLSFSEEYKNNPNLRLPHDFVVKDFERKNAFELGAKKNAIDGLQWKDASERQARKNADEVQARNVEDSKDALEGNPKGESKGESNEKSTDALKGESTGALKGESTWEPKGHKKIISQTEDDFQDRHRSSPILERPSSGLLYPESCVISKTVKPAPKPRSTRASPVLGPAGNPPSLPSDSSRSSKLLIECWRCKQFGHYARDCPGSGQCAVRDSIANQNSTTTSVDLDSSSFTGMSVMSCYICKSEHHFWRVCPEAACPHVPEALLCDQYSSRVSQEQLQNSADQPQNPVDHQVQQHCFSRRFILFAPSKCLRRDLLDAMMECKDTAGGTNNMVDAKNGVDRDSSDRDGGGHQDGADGGGYGLGGSMKSGKSNKSNSKSDQKPSEKVKQLRLDVVARMIMSAMWLGHGIRSNTVFDIWAKEGYYRFSSHPAMKAKDYSGGKLAFNEAFLVKFLQKMEPVHKMDHNPSDRVDKLKFLQQIHLVEGPGFSVGVKSPEVGDEQGFHSHSQTDSVNSVIDSTGYPTTDKVDLGGTRWLQRILLLEETADEDFRAVCERDVNFRPGGFCCLLGDHEGISREDLGWFHLGGEATPGFLPLVPVTLGGNSLLGSACVTIMHYELDRIHVCRVKKSDRGWYQNQ